MVTHKRLAISRRNTLLPVAFMICGRKIIRALETIFMREDKGSNTFDIDRKGFCPLSRTELFIFIITAAGFGLLALRYFADIVFVFFCRIQCITVMYIYFSVCTKERNRTCSCSANCTFSLTAAVAPLRNYSAVSESYSRCMSPRVLAIPSTIFRSYQCG